jgi:quercetin dioxygenase-like cupin family protein
MKYRALALPLVIVVLGAGSLSAQAAATNLVSRDAVPTYVNETGNIGMTILFDEASVGSDVGLSLGTFLPGAVVAEHVHAGAAELLYVLSGELEVTISGRPVTVREGSAVYIAPDAPHSARVIGAIEQVKVVQVYSPGGPEQRFRAWRVQ